MREFNIEKKYMKTEQYKIWAISFALCISFIFGVFGPAIIGFLAMVYMVGKIWKKAHVLTMSLLVFGFSILMSIVYSNALIFGVVGACAIVYIIATMWNEINLLLKYSILGDKDGIWYKNRRKSDALIKWEEMKSTKNEDGFLNVQNQNATSLIKLSCELEFYDKLKDLIEKNINGELSQDEIKSAFGGDEELKSEDYPIVFSSGEFYDFSVKTFLGVGVSVVLASLLLYILKFSIYFSGVMYVVIFFILFVVAIFWMTPRRLEIFEDSLTIFYTFKRKHIPFEAIEKVDLLKFASRKDNATSKVRIVTKDEQYYSVYNFYQDDEDIIKSIKQAMDGFSLKSQ